MRKWFGFGGAKEKEVESVEIPSDSHKENSQDITDFDTLLSSMETCGDAVLDALNKLQTAPSPLLDCLSNSHNTDCAGKELLESLSVQLNACVYRLTLGTPHLEEMMRRVKKLKPDVESAKENIAKREAAWNVKVRCDKDTNELKQKGTGPVISVGDRQKRLKAKYEADEEFKSISDVVSKQCNEVLYNRWSNTAAALTDLCHCYAEIFEAPPKLAGDLLKSAAKLTSRSKHFEEPPEDGDASQETNDNDGKDILPSLPTGASPPSTTAPASSMTGTSPKHEQDPATNVGASKSERSADKSNDDGSKTPTSSKLHFAKGECVKVWSSSQNKWLDAIVKEIFTAASIEDHYKIPAGVVKVESAAGVKFVQPEQLGKLLRKTDTVHTIHTAGTPRFSNSSGQL